MGSRSMTSGSAFAVLGLLVLAPGAAAQCEQAMLQAQDTYLADEFGASVAIHGDWAVVGAPRQNGTVFLADGSGAADVFRREGDGWVHDTRLLPDDAFADMYFGAGVAIHGATLAVSAPGASTTYVFEHLDGEWRATQELVPFDGDAPGYGTDVDMDAERIVVGANGVELPGEYIGAAFVYRRDGPLWVDEARLEPSDADFDAGLGRSFGWRAAVSARTIVVGAPTDGEGGEWVGAAYVYVLEDDEWTELAKLRPFGGDTGQARFGISVDVDGGRIAVGGEGYSGSVSPLGQFGAAYLFRQQGSQVLVDQRVESNFQTYSAHFGTDVAIDGERLIVGERHALWSTGSAWRGAAHLYVHDGDDWVHAIRYTSARLEIGLYFGMAVDLDGDTAIVGSKAVEPPVYVGTLRGGAFVFGATSGLPTWEPQGAGLAPERGGAPCLSAMGTLEAGEPVTITLSGAEQGAAAAIVLGADHFGTPGGKGALGTPLLQGSLVPMPDLLLVGLSTDASGALELAGAWPRGVPPGTELWAQAWIADPDAPAGYAVSNALLGRTP